MPKNKRTRGSEFETSLVGNEISYHFYVDRLTELSVSMFEWNNLPDSCDQRYIETRLFRNGSIVFFEDEVMGLLSLDCIPQGRLDAYGYPLDFRAYSGYNNYSKKLDQSNGAIVFNNYMRTNSLQGALYYAKRLWQLDRIIDMNANAQKTPIMLQCGEKERLTLLNLYKEYDGNAPVIYGQKSIDMGQFTVLKTDAPYNADKLYELKTSIWNEALTFLGIANINVQKKERLITDEVTRNQGGTIASRYSRLEMRRQGVDKVNKMFGTNIEVDFRQDYREADDEVMLSGATEDFEPTTMIHDLRTKTKDYTAHAK